MLNSQKKIIKQKRLLKNRPSNKQKGNELDQDMKERS